MKIKDYQKAYRTMFPKLWPKGHSKGDCLRFAMSFVNVFVNHHVEVYYNSNHILLLYDGVLFDADGVYDITVLEDEDYFIHWMYGKEYFTSAFRTYFTEEEFNNFFKKLEHHEKV